MIIDITSDFSIDIGNGTDVGKVREKNEDYLESFESPFGYVFVVCDGMGGHTAGEVASRLAVATIKENILNNPQGITSTKQIIIDSINLANHRIIEKWTDEPELKGMGTTVVVLIVKTNIAYYAHVGDSRMYMIRNSHIYQMTRDHSFVQTLVDGGLISYEESETHPRKNEIMQALGITTDIKVDINNIGLNLYKNDTFILCSDGLSGLIKDEEIQRIVNTNDPQEAALKLISTANNNGGFDNITVQVVKVVKGLSTPKGKEDAAPLGALNKNVIGIKQNAFKPHSFDKTSELPAFNNVAKKKNKTMLYVLLVALIIIIGGLSYYIINSKEQITNIPNNIISNDSILHIAQKEIPEFFSSINSKDTLTKYKKNHFVIENIDFIDLDSKTHHQITLKELREYFSLKKFSRYISCQQDKTDKYSFIVMLSFLENVSAKVKGEINGPVYKVKQISLKYTDKDDLEADSKAMKKRTEESKTREGKKNKGETLQKEKKEEKKEENKDEKSEAKKEEKKEENKNEK